MTEVGPGYTFQDFQLAEHELLSGEPVFLVPRDTLGNACHVDLATLMEAYTYQHCRVSVPIHPCQPADWDAFALCLSNHRMGTAMLALGVTAELMQRNGMGYFSRYPQLDLRWAEV